MSDAVTSGFLELIQLIYLSFVLNVKALTGILKEKILGETRNEKVIIVFIDWNFFNWFW